MDQESIKTFRHPADPARCEEEFKGRRLKAEGGRGIKNCFLRPFPVLHAPHGLGAELVPVFARGSNNSQEPFPVPGQGSQEGQIIGGMYRGPVFA